MGLCGRTREHLEIEAGKAGNYTLVVEETDFLVAQIECH